MCKSYFVGKGATSTLKTVNAVVECVAICKKKFWPKILTSSCFTFTAVCNSPLQQTMKTRWGTERIDNFQKHLDTVKLVWGKLLNAGNYRVSKSSWILWGACYLLIQQLPVINCRFWLAKIVRIRGLCDYPSMAFQWWGRWKDLVDVEIAAQLYL